jgi:hypothetical protein
MGLLFTIAAGPGQRSHSQVRVPRDSSYFTVPYSRLPHLEGQVYSPGTGFHFRCLLQLAGLRWKYSIPPPHGKFTSLNESESYVTTDAKSTSLSWNKAPIWGLRPDFYYRQTVSVSLIWGALSDEMTGQSFTILAGRQRSHSRVRDPWNSRVYFTASDSRLPFSSQGYSGGIRTRLNTARPNCLLCNPFARTD